MIIDIHAHLMASSFAPGRHFNLWNAILWRKLGVSTAEEYVKKLMSDLDGSPLDKVILCAVEGSEVAAGNAEVLKLCQRDSRFLYGVNLNPLSPSIKTELETAVAEGAVLVKLLPSWQGVKLDAPECTPFWEMTAKLRLPVLVHTGPEHTFRGDNRLNTPAYLKTAAELGVTIICAHCGCNMMLHEHSYFREWAELARTYPNVYGDISGFSGCVRHYWLKRILKDETLKNKLLFGTDYPSFPYVFKRNHPNLFTGWLDFYASKGLDDRFFHRATEVLNVSET